MCQKAHKRFQADCLEQSILVDTLVDTLIRKRASQQIAMARDSMNELDAFEPSRGARTTVVAEFREFLQVLEHFSGRKRRKVRQFAAISTIKFVLLMSKRVTPGVNSSISGKSVRFRTN
jgi:hypothetical protein